MSSTRSCVISTAFAVAIGAVESPVVLASTPTGTPAANPAHPVWNSNKEIKVRTKSKQRLKSKRQGDQLEPAHDVPPPPLHHHPVPVQQTDPSPQIDSLASPAVRPPEELSATVSLERHQRAEQAYQAAQTLLASGKHNEAVEQLDMASELDPKWSAPVRLRAEAFGQLALRYHPSQAFRSAQAADLQRLMTLEPNVDAAARTQQLIALRTRSDDARQKEERRRRMVKPALIVGSLSVALIVGGAFLAAGVYPSTEPDALRQRSMVIGGIVMASVGVGIAPAAITLGVLAGRQAKRDQATRELNAYTGRPQPTLGLAPRLFPGGGGLGAQLRF